MKNHLKVFDFAISRKTFIGSKPLQIRLNNRDGITRIYHGTRYLTLFGSEKIMLFKTKSDIL